MATGFECDFVEKPPTTFPQFECPICLLVLREPYQATCCGKSFCKRCIHQIKAANQACPTCNEKDFTLFPNKGLQQPLYNFRVYCTHKSKGCEWIGELRELDNHLNSDPPTDKSLQGCLFTLLKCPLDCAKCVKGVYRKDVKSHVSDKLLDKVVVHGAQMKSFEQQLQHISSQFEALLKRIKEDFEQRVTELETEVGELKVQNGELKSEIKALKLKRPAEGVSEGQPISKQQPVPLVTGSYKPIGAEFTMTDFNEYQMDNDEWFSSPFYTHPDGYKMCLKVFANGNNLGKDTHLSVYMRLMRGEFDDQLKWPFRGRITIKLVDQEQNKDHVVKTLSIDALVSEKYNERVVGKDRSSEGQGFSKFIPLAELRPKYLKNDCIKSCIKRVELL